MKFGKKLYFGENLRKKLMRTMLKSKKRNIRKLVSRIGTFGSTTWARKNQRQQKELDQKWSEWKRQDSRSLQATQSGPFLRRETLYLRVKIMWHLSQLCQRSGYLTKNKVMWVTEVFRNKSMTQFIRMQTLTISLIKAMLLGYRRFRGYQTQTLLRTLNHLWTYLGKA